MSTPAVAIVHTNNAGNAILDAADFLRAVCGRLVASDLAINAALREILVAANAGDAALGVKGIALPLTAHDGERYVAHVLPLTSGARREAGLAYNAVAALFIRKASLEAFSPPEVIGEMYKLTPTELRVLLAIVDIGGVPEVAAALGVASPRSRLTSAACLKKPAFAARPIWSSSSPGFLRRWLADANHSSKRTANAPAAARLAAVMLWWLTVQQIVMRRRSNGG